MTEDFHIMEQEIGYYFNMKYLYVGGDSMSDGSCLIEYSDKRIKRLKLKHTEWDIGFDERWSKLLSDKLDLEEINQARHGNSNDKIFRTTMDWAVNHIEDLSETLFVIGWTGYDRFEFYDNYLDRYVQVSNGEPTHNDRDDKRLQKYVIQYWKEQHNKEEVKDNYLRKIISLQSFFQSNNISYLFFDAIGFQVNVIKENKYSLFLDKNHWWNYDKSINSFHHIAEKLKSFGIDFKDDGHGSNGHPGIEAHEKLSEELYVKVKNIL